MSSSGTHATTISFVLSSWYVLVKQSCPYQYLEKKRALADLWVLGKAPLDYQNSNLGEAVIPLVKIPAAVDTSDDAYRGMVIFSPGGFGLSGINVTIENQDIIRPMIGANSDIVAFDPRGFGLSSPSLACGSLNPRGSKTKRSVPRLADRFAEDKLVAAMEAGENCKQMVGGPTDAGPHSSTATIARDVMRIVDAYSRTVDGKAAPDDGKLLNFLGWSFATYIGQTIASMFPDRIGGMVLDGMIDPISAQANFTSNSVNDVDGIIASFFVYCAEAGPEQCSYHTGTSPMDIWKRFAKSFVQLDTNCGDVQREDALLSLKAALIAFAYSPLALFPQMAQVLLALEEALESKALPDWTEDVKVSIDPSFLGNVSVPAMAVVCPEQGNRWYGEELQEFQPLIEETKMQSIVGELYGTSVILGCHGWSIDSSEVYEGAFGGQTLNPILFISNAYDFPCPKKK